VIFNKSELKRKLKVSTVDIQIKRSRLKVSNSKVVSCVKDIKPYNRTLRKFLTKIALHIFITVLFEIHQ